MRLIIFVLVVVCCILVKRKKDKQKNERKMSFRVIPEEDLTVHADMNKEQTQHTSVKPLPQPPDQSANLQPHPLAQPLQSGFSPFDEDFHRGEATVPLSAAWSGHQADPEATSQLLGTFSRPSAYLIRKKTGERIVIDAPEFTVGKDETKADYCVRDNTAVSRRHLQIVLRGDRYYLVDLESKNQTFLNNVPIAPLMETELQNGDSIVAADEEFVLEIR